MEMDVTKQGEVTVIKLIGRLDANTSKNVEMGFLKRVEEGETRFVYDLTELNYISSAGLRVLLLSAKKTKAIQGKLVLACLSEQVEEVFSMSGFSAIFHKYDTLEEAIAAVQD